MPLPKYDDFDADGATENAFVVKQSDPTTYMLNCTSQYMQPNIKVKVDGTEVGENLAVENPQRNEIIHEAEVQSPNVGQVMSYREKSPNVKSHQIGTGVGVDIDIDLLNELLNNVKLEISNNEKKQQSDINFNKDPGDGSIQGRMNKIFPQEKSTLIGMSLPTYMPCETAGQVTALLDNVDKKFSLPTDVTENFENNLVCSPGLSDFSEFTNNSQQQQQQQQLQKQQEQDQNRQHLLSEHFPSTFSDSNQHLTEGLPEAASNSQEVLPEEIAFHTQSRGEELQISENLGSLDFSDIASPFGLKYPEDLPVSFDNFDCPINTNPNDDFENADGSRLSDATAQLDVSVNELLSLLSPAFSDQLENGSENNEDGLPDFESPFTDNDLLLPTLVTSANDVGNFPSEKSKIRNFDTADPEENVTLGQSVMASTTSTTPKHEKSLFADLKGSSEYCEKLGKVQELYVKSKEELKLQLVTLETQVRNNAVSVVEADFLWSNIKRQLTIFQNNAQKIAEQEQANAQEKLRLNALPERRRRNLPPKATKVLNKWFAEHIDHPYIQDDDERAFLAEAAAITQEQVNTWLSNKRNRTRKRISARAPKN